jgi:hypothetical protein
MSVPKGVTLPTRTVPTIVKEHHPIPIGDMSRRGISTLRKDFAHTGLFRSVVLLHVGVADVQEMH